jgi:biphenyl-2,3-diol 1,2-dioxygenase
MPGNSEGRFRIDSRDWRLALQEGSKDDLAYMGFEVATSEKLHMLEARIATAGLTAKRADAELLKTWGVSELVTTEGPAGLPSSTAGLWIAERFHFTRPWVLRDS